MSAPTIGGLNVSGHQLVPRDRVFTCLDPEFRSRIEYNVQLQL